MHIVLNVNQAVVVSNHAFNNGLLTEYTLILYLPEVSTGRRGGIVCQDANFSQKKSFSNHFHKL